LAAKGDPTLLRQVLIGLLSNAITHTEPPGAVTLRGRRGDGEVVLEVVDSGIGIPPDEVDRVFERFYRSSESLAHEGFGLGLAIAKRLVEAHSGTIWVDREVRDGTRMVFTLPVRDDGGR
jgi:signal transduction histidine kinase